MKEMMSAAPARGYLSRRRLARARARSRLRVRLGDLDRTLAVARQQERTTLRLVRRRRPRSF